MSAPIPLIDHGRMLDVVGIEGELLLDAAGRALPHAAHNPVPGCPGLTLGETVRHVGAVHRVTRQWVAHDQRPEQWQRAPVDGDLVTFVRSGLSELVTELERHDPAAPCDTWWPADRSHGFWRRRMAHETTVHRVDVQASAGMTVDPIDDPVALDGIDEVLFLWFGHRLGQLGMTSPQPGAVGISAGGRYWLAVFELGRSTARRMAEADFTTADAVVSGEALAVYLWMWGRAPDQSVSISGEPDAAAQLWALLRPATQ
ncbi:MAG: hypothetical protein GEV09_24305 [Pseudonocardiaceae bacterium]|nr:hypothetical protein [Pseudonocardiaceae bacterium]